MKNYSVRMRCVVMKEVYCEAENEEQVRASPWDYATDELETDQVDWEVISVKEDK